MSNSELQLVPVSPIAPLAEPLEQTPAGSGADPLRGLFAVLRRHWMWLAPLGIVLALAGAATGYRMVPVKYRSVGYIRIRPILPRVLYQTEQAGVMPMFDAFVQSQVTQIASQRVTAMAMQSPAWKSLGRGTTPEEAEQFNGSLEVGHDRGTEIIFVTFTDRSIEAATAGVKAVIEAYQNIYTEADGNQSAQTLNVLEGRKTIFAAELKSLQERVMGIGNEFGSTALGQSYDFRRTELGKLESELQQLQVAIALASAKPAATDEQDQPLSMVAQVIARIDPEMRESLRQRQAAARRLELLKLRLMPNHRDVVEAQAALDQLSKEIEQAVEQYRNNPAAGVSPESGAGAQTLGQLQERERNLTVLVERARQATLDLGRKHLQIERLQSEIEEKRKRLAEIDARMEQLSVESEVGGRLKILSYGEVPTSPYKDKRKQAAAAGAMGGLVLCAGVALLISLGGRRCDSIADAKDTTQRAGRLLGILPSLPEDLSDPEQAAMAAHYVHHIRVLLQLITDRSGPSALAITSSASGSGKTSLTQALGLSFAASGTKTLLVDCDIVGGGLTRRMESTIRRRLGQILLREDLVGAEDLEEALRIAKATQRRLGEVLVERGLVREADIERAVRLQKQSMVGLLDMLAGKASVESIIQTGIPNLFVLPLGLASPQHIGKLSPAAIHQVLDEARKSFGVVLVDTGPVPGSIEASMVAAEADQVVMVVSRGEHRQGVDQALAFLQSLGAKVCGVVFNRAKAGDIAHSGFSSRVSMPAGDVPLDHASSAHPRLGPVARAVASVTDVSGQDQGTHP